MPDGEYVIVVSDSKSDDILEQYKRRWKIGVSREGHMNPVGESPTEVRSSSLVAWEAPWREIKTVKPSDTMLFGACAKHQVVTCSERGCSLVTRNSGGRAALLPAKAARIARKELEATILTGGVSAATWCEGACVNWRSPRCPAEKSRRGGVPYNREWEMET